MLNRLVSLFRNRRVDRSMGADQTTENGSEDPSTGVDGEGNTDGTATGDPGSTEEDVGAPTSWHALLDGEEVSKQEIQMTLGLQPHEFLLWLVRDAGGHMWQADMVDATGWSKSTVSRYLDTLESSGLVERVWIGRRKLVGVPGQMPDPVPEADGSPVEPASSSWSAEADEPA